MWHEIQSGVLINQVVLMYFRVFFRMGSTKNIMLKPSIYACAT